MSTLLRDLRYAGRSLARNPSVSAVAILCLGLGIGANTTVFSAANALAFHPLPQVRDPGRLVTLAETPRKGGREGETMSPGALRDVADERPAALGRPAAFAWWNVNVTGGELAERAPAYRVSPSFFGVLGVRPALGRDFLPDDATPGRGRIVLLGHALWQRRFGGDPGIAGRAIELNGEPYVVAGVMPADFMFPSAAELWVPLALAEPEASERHARFLTVLARLAAGAGLDEARAQLDPVARRLETERPEVSAGWTLRLDAAEERFGQGPRPFLVVLLAAVGFVLLITCSNVANLLLARATGRRREMAVRMALGAGRGRIVAQVLAESFLLGALGGALGLLLSFWGVSLVASGIPAELHTYVVGFSLLRVDGRALAFTLVVSLATGIVFGLAPALAASRPGIQDALREGSRGATVSRRTSRLRGGLVVAEMTLSVVLLTGASLMVRSFASLVAADPGFRPDRVLTMRVTLPPLGYERQEAVAAWFDRLLERISGLSGIQKAAAVSILPMSWNEQREAVEIEGRAPQRTGEGPRLGLRVASPGYFQALSIPMRAGRAFTTRDSGDAPRVAVVSESAARRLWPGESAVGHRLRAAPGKEWVEVVGVAGDVRHNVLLTAEPKQVLYLPLSQKPRSTMSLVIRAAGEPLAAVTAVQTTIAALEPRAAAGDVLTLRRVMESALSPQRVTAVMLLIFAAIGVSLAASGIYGVLAYTVAQRRHEFGVRMALGARRADILRLVLSQAVRLCGTGVALGLAGAFALVRVLRSVLFETTGADPFTFAALPLALLAVGLASSLFPARRATRVDPIAALRSE